MPHVVTRVFCPCLLSGLVIAIGGGCAPTPSMTTREPIEMSSDEVITEESTPVSEPTESMQAPAEEEAESPASGSSEPPTLAQPSLLSPVGAVEATSEPDASGLDNDVVVLVTARGRLVIELYSEDAPKHVENFKKLVNQRFYVGAARRFHRYEPGFVIQGGDPKGDGTGGPGYTIPAEIKRKHVKGAVAMARLADSVNPQQESSGSQFYICLNDLPQLDGEYTVFGMVVQGMSVVERLRKSDEITNATVRPRSDVIQ